MLQVLGKPADPSAAIALEEAAWEYLLAQATDLERTRLQRMNRKERAEQIRLVLEQVGDQFADER